MTQSKTKSTTYWKQAKNGLIAHVYEHIASSYITGCLVDNDLFFIADFDHWANTYGTTLHLDFNIHSNKAARVLEKAFSEFKKSKISLEESQKAAQQIAAEYGRPLMQLTEEFVHELQLLHQEAWSDIRNLGVFQADEKTSVNTVFSMPGIRYGRKTPKSFVQSTLHFEIDAKLYEREPDLKAFSVLLTQAVALNIHRKLEKSYVYYDIGDQWDWGATTVAYRTTLRLPKSAPYSIQELQYATDQCLQAIKKGVLIPHLSRLLISTYKTESSHYFSREAMNEITNGIIIGYEGWKSVAKHAKLQLILDAISVQVLDYETSTQE